MSAETLLLAMLVGIGATLTMDAWNLFLRRAFGVASLSYCLLGRWVAHTPAGTFRHMSIRAAEPKPHECSLGWAAHYAIGVALAVGFAALASDAWLVRPTLLPAVAYGAVTVAAPYFILQPGLGLGIASSRAPAPGRARLKSLGTHVVYGIGLYASAVVVGWVLRLGR